MKEAGSSEIADDVASGRLELGVVTLPIQARDLLAVILDGVEQRVEKHRPRHHDFCGLCANRRTQSAPCRQNNGCNFRLVKLRQRSQDR